MYTLVARKYYMDDLYEGLIVREGLYNFATRIAQWFDTNVIDSVVNGSASVARRTGDGLRWVQSGSVQAYGSVGFAGLVAASVIMLVMLEK